ncbi:hypothetical protein LMIY3S_04450 [Labrys miyagiensis]
MNMPKLPPVALWTLAGAFIWVLFTLISNDWSQRAPSIGVVLLAAAVGGVWGTSLSTSEDD